VLVAVSDQMEAEGVPKGEEAMMELRRRAWEVQAAREPCPVMDSCEEYAQALARGASPRCAQPQQLSFLT